MSIRIKDWDSLFETAETKKLKHLRWVPAPNKHDGKSYRRITQMTNGLEVFGTWMLILQIASKMPKRGILEDQDGPITSEDMSLMTGFPINNFEAAIKILSDPKIGWLVVENTQAHEVFEKSPDVPANLPEVTGLSPAEGKEGKEENVCPNDKSSVQESSPSKPKTKKLLSEEEWWKELEGKFPGIDLDLQRRRAEAWLLTRPGRKFTRNFFTNWILRIDHPIAPKAEKPKGESHFAKELGIE